MDHGVASEQSAELRELGRAALAAGRAAGLDAIGMAPAHLLEPARSVLPLRKAQGLSGSMQFTYRNPDRSTDPGRSMPARTLVAAALHYRRQPPAGGKGLTARVARYAWEDYYAELRDGLGAVADVLRSAGWRAEVHADDNHLVDRNVAYLAGLGWYGKNANLLLPGRGSWFVLGAVLTDAPLVTDPPQPIVDDCGACRRCIEGCPTEAIVAPGVVDARRCLAWLVQGPGPIPVEFRSALGDRIYGCDDCQEVCPPNQRLAAGSVPPLADDTALVNVELAFLLEAADDELLDRLGRWYIAGRDPRVLRRTALVVLGNTGNGAEAETRRLLRPYLGHPDELLAEHAAWAAEQLGLDADPDRWP